MGSPNQMVYIVDDDPTVCDALSSLLRANGQNVQTLTSGEEFLSFEREDTAACLVLDLKMPGMGGLGTPIPLIGDPAVRRDVGSRALVQ